MITAYVAVNSLLAVGMAWCAFAEFIRLKPILAQLTRARVPESWLPTLATFKLVFLVGVLVGFGVPVIGMAAAIGVALYFVGAVVWHVAAHDSNVGGAVFFLILGCAALALRVAASSSTN